MNDWHELVAAKNWEKLDDFWQDQPEAVCGEILEALRQIVPLVERINGTEREPEFARPDEVDPDIAGAARILFLGELEAAADRPEGPPSSLQQWAQISEDVRRICSELAALPEVTDGTPHMSRVHHSDEAVALTDTIVSVMQAMLVSDDGDEELAAALQEHVATAVVYAFTAGRHFQLALGKETEPDALRGMRVRIGGRNSGLLGGRRAEARSAVILAEMDRMIEENPHLKPTRAAALAHRKGYGTSAEANRKLWKRRKNKSGT